VDPVALSIPRFDDTNEAKIVLIFWRGSKSERVNQASTQERGKWRAGFEAL
jgi:hypothetical protein